MLQMRLSVPWFPITVSCYHSSACSNINIDCVDKPSCECHDVDGIQCTNNVNGNYITDELSTTQAPKEPKSNALVLIIFVIIFWILVCLVVPICFVRRFRNNLLAKQKQSKPIKAHRQSVSDTKEHSNTNSKDQVAADVNPNQVESESQSKDVNKDAPNKKRQRVHSTHRRAMSNSMMARIKEHLNVDIDNENECKEKDQAAAMIPYIETNDDGELVVPVHIVAAQLVQPPKPQPIAAQLEQNGNELRPIEEPLVMKVTPSMNEGGDVSSYEAVSDLNHAENDRFSEDFP